MLFETESKNEDSERMSMRNYFSKKNDIPDHIDYFSQHVDELKYSSIEKISLILLCLIGVVHLLGLFVIFQIGFHFVMIIFEILFGSPIIHRYHKQKTYKDKRFGFFLSDKFITYHSPTQQYVLILHQNATLQHCDFS